MSALGQKQTFAAHEAGCPRSANSGHCIHSITSLGRPISVFGTLRPSALAVLRLRTPDFRGLLDRQVRGLIALENPAGIDAGEAV